MKKRLLAMLLVCVMLMGSICLSALAADTEDDISTVEEGGSGGSTGGENGGNTGSESGGNTGGESGGNTGGESGGNTSGEGGGNTGGESGGNTGGEGGGNTGGESGGNTGGESGGNTGGESGGSTGGEGGGSTGGEGGGTTTPCTHTYDAGTVTKKATCKEKGTKTYKCTACGETKTETLDYAGHTYEYACDAWCSVCGAEREITHTKSSQWTKNASGHWHRCTVCGEELDKADHYPGPAATEEKDQICLTCGYVMTPKKKHTHQYGEKLSFDETGHWYPCVSCDNKKDFAQHTLSDTCASRCDLCGYEAEVEHTYGYKWESDDASHRAICSVCGQTGENEAHVPGAPATESTAQLCNICGYELSPKTGSTAAETTAADEIGTGWQTDTMTHWHLDANGRKQDEALHSWDLGTDRWNGDVVYTCTVCGAERIEGERDAANDTQTAAKAGGIHWSILVLGVLIVLFIGASVALILVIRKSKSAQGRFAQKDKSK